MGILSDQYQEDWKSRLRRKKDAIFTNCRSGTLARRQVTLLENSVYRGEGGKYNIWGDLAILVILTWRMILRYSIVRRTTRSHTYFPPNQKGTLAKGGLI